MGTIISIGIVCLLYGYVLGSRDKKDITGTVEIKKPKKKKK